MVPTIKVVSIIPILWTPYQLPSPIFTKYLVIVNKSLVEGSTLPTSFMDSPLHFVNLSKQAMEWLSRQTEIEVEFMLYDLVFLFQQLVTTAPIDAPSRMTLGAAESHLTRDVFLYLPSMSCRSHRSMESCKCAGARVSRCAFIICDFCCQMYGKLRVQLQNRVRLAI